MAEDTLVVGIGLNAADLKAIADQLNALRETVKGTKLEPAVDMSGITAGVFKGNLALDLLKQALGWVWEAAKAAASAIRDLFVESVKNAAADETSLNRLRGMFGSLASDAQKFAAEVAKGSGSTASSVQDVMSLLQGESEAITTTRGEAFELTRNLTQVAGALSQVGLGSQEEIGQKLWQAINGSNKALRDFGITLNNVAIRAKAEELGFDPKNLTDVQTKLVRAKLIVEELGDAEAWAAENAGSWNDLMRRAGNAVSEAFGQIGAYVMPIVKQVGEYALSVFQSWAQDIPEYMSAVAASMKWLWDAASVFVGQLTDVFANVKNALGVLASAIVYVLRLLGIEGGFDMFSNVIRAIGLVETAVLGTAVAFMTLVGVAQVAMAKLQQMIAAGAMSMAGVLKPFVNISEDAKTAYDGLMSFAAQENANALQNLQGGVSKMNAFWSEEYQRLAEQAHQMLFHASDVATELKKQNTVQEANAALAQKIREYFKAQKEIASQLKAELQRVKQAQDDFDKDAQKGALDLLEARARATKQIESELLVLQRRRDFELSMVKEVQGADAKRAQINMQYELRRQALVEEGYRREAEAAERLLEKRRQDQQTFEQFIRSMDEEYMKATGRGLEAQVRSVSDKIKQGMTSMTSTQDMEELLKRVPQAFQGVLADAQKQAADSTQKFMEATAGTDTRAAFAEMQAAQARLDTVRQQVNAAIASLKSDIAQKAPELKAGQSAAQQAAAAVEAQKQRDQLAKEAPEKAMNIGDELRAKFEELKAGIQPSMQVAQDLVRRATEAAQAVFDASKAAVEAAQAGVTNFQGQMEGWIGAVDAFAATTTDVMGTLGAKLDSSAKLLGDLGANIKAINDLTTGEDQKAAAQGYMGAPGLE